MFLMINEYILEELNLQWKQNILETTIIIFQYIIWFFQVYENKLPL